MLTEDLIRQEQNKKLINVIDKLNEKHYSTLSQYSEDFNNLLHANQNLIAFISTETNSQIETLKLEFNEKLENLESIFNKLKNELYEKYTYHKKDLMNEFKEALRSEENKDKSFEEISYEYKLKINDWKIKVIKKLEKMREIFENQKNKLREKYAEEIKRLASIREKVLTNPQFLLINSLSPMEENPTNEKIEQLKQNFDEEISELKNKLAEC